MRVGRLLGVVLLLLFCSGTAFAGERPPRSARLVKQAGNQFLAAKKYADAVDCYYQALGLHPEYGEAHYNLGVAFLRGYKAINVALHHFEGYLSLEPYAEDRENVEALILALRQRTEPVPQDAKKVFGVVAGRLLVSGAEWVKNGQRIEVGELGESPRARLITEYVYPKFVVTQRIRDEETLNQVKPGLVAINISDRIFGF